jgi:hypothetical protein
LQENGRLPFAEEFSPTAFTYGHLPFDWKPLRKITTPQLMISNNAFVNDGIDTIWFFRISLVFIGTCQYGKSLLSCSLFNPVSIIRTTNLKILTD